MTTTDRTARAVQELQEHDPRQVGPYRLLGLLGGGGMGQVYLAVGPDGPVAVKIVHPWLASDEEFRIRFAREVATSRRVQSPWTATVVDADTDGRIPWFATEYVPGVPLDRAVQVAGPLPAASVHVLAADMARALAAIHAAGLIHRDVKPANMLLTIERPYLIDFGIARALDATRVTATGVAIGTPAFMSPEQADGLHTGSPSDLFSLGSVVVFAATGAGPFGDDTPLGVMRRIRTDEPDLGRLAEPLRSHIARCLRRDPAERPTPDELAAALEPLPPVHWHGWLPPTVAALVPEPPVFVAPEAGARRFSRRSLLLGAGAVGVVGGATAIGLSLGGPDVTTPEPPGVGPPGQPPAAPSSVRAAPPRAGGDPSLRWTYPAAGEVRGMALGDELLYAGSTESEVVALDLASGQARWTHTVKGSVSEPPALTGDVVAVSDSLTAHVLDAATGQPRWRTDFTTVVGAGSGVVLGRVYDPASPSSFALTAFDAASGTPRWTHPIPNSEVPFHLLPAFDDGGRVHVGLGRSLVTFDVASGAIQRELTSEAVVEEVGLVDDVLYYRPNTDAGAVFVALDAATGAPRWRRETKGASPIPSVVVEDSIFLSPGSSFALWDAATGEPRWQIDQEFSDGAPPWPSLNLTRFAGAAGTCYVGGSQLVYGPDGELAPGHDGLNQTVFHLFAYAADSGELRWAFPIDPGPGHAAPLLAVPGTVFLGGDTATVHAVAV